MLCKLLEFVGNVILFYENLGSSLNRRTKNTLITDFNQLITLRENCPNMEFFLVRIFSHSNWIWRDTKYLSVFSPNAGKYRPEKTPYLDTFHAGSLPSSKLIRSESSRCIYHADFLVQNKLFPEFVCLINSFMTEAVTI